MKILYIVRHAKSSWSDPLQPDVDRPLNERGLRDAPNMGKRLKEQIPHPDILITSPTKRTLDTCKIMAGKLGYDEQRIRVEPKLYHANEDQMLEVVRTLGDNFHTVVVFGHNPGLTNLVNELMDEDMLIDNVPTCGIAGFEFRVVSWKDVKFGKGKLIFYDFPKRIED